MKNFAKESGTGAKCLEHLLHSCAAGLGQKTFGKFDQDEANGNVSRTKILLSKYMIAEVRLDEGKHDLAEDSDLFKTNIITNNDSVWLPRGADLFRRSNIL